MAASETLRTAFMAALAELLAHIELPLLQVRRDALCVPLVGEFDAFRTG